MQKIIQAIGCALRNRQRRKLCREWARNTARNKRIIAELGLLNARADIEATAERIADEWPAEGDLKPQAAILRGEGAVHEVSHLASDLRHFRREYCGAAYPVAPFGIAEDDACLGGEVRA